MGGVDGCDMMGSMINLLNCDEPRCWMLSSPSRTLDFADTLTAESVREPRYHLWNLKRLGWSDDDILTNAAEYHQRLVDAINALSLVS